MGTSLIPDPDLARMRNINIRGIKHSYKSISFPLWRAALWLKSHPQDSSAWKQTEQSINMMNFTRTKLCPPNESDYASLQCYTVVTLLVYFSWNTVISSYSWPADSSCWLCDLIPIPSMNKGGWQKAGKYIAQNNLALAVTQTRISTWLVGSQPTTEGDLEPALSPCL